MSKMRESPNREFWALVFTEELAHCIWPKLTEDEIKIKDLEILRRFIPSFDINTLLGLDVVFDNPQKYIRT